MWLVMLGWSAGAADTLPVRRVRIYETGVAWFERSGAVRGSTTLELPQSHLDDALKSLVVLGGGAHVRAITFPTAVSDRAARQLAGLPDETTFGEGLRALVGGPVAIRTSSGQRHQGTLLSVDAISAIGGAEGPRVLDVPTWALGLLTPEGALLRLVTPDVAEVRSLAPDQQWRLEQAGRSFASSRAQQLRGLRIDVARAGTLALGYLAEAPVWRTSYRIVSDDDGTAQLQAWALVHNDTDEDWSRVAIEVANGQPRSFLYPLAAPRYLRRDLVVPETAMSTVPQLASVTPDGLWDEDDTGSVGGLGASGSAFGSGVGGFGTAGHGSLTASVTDLRDAEPVDTPTQFVVRVAEPVDLPAHHSALVPLGMNALTTEGVIAFAPGSTQPRTAVWMANTTGRTLPAGVVSVLAAGGLSGETVLARTRPDERQMLLVGDELDVDLERSTTTDTPRDDAVAWDPRARRWTVTTTRGERTTLSLRNRTGSPQAIWTAFSLSEGSTVGGDRRSEIDPERGWTWVVSDAAPGPSTEDIVIQRSTTAISAADGVDASTYRQWADAGLADGGVLRRAATLRERIAELDASAEDLGARDQRALDTLERLRGDLQAADGSATTRSLTRRIASLEQDVLRNGERAAEFGEQRASALSELHAALDGLRS